MPYDRYALASTCMYPESRTCTARGNAATATHHTLLSLFFFTLHGLPLSVALPLLFPFSCAPVLLLCTQQFGATDPKQNRDKICLCDIPDFTIAPTALRSNHTIFSMRSQTPAVSCGHTTAGFHATTVSASVQDTIPRNKHVNHHWHIMRADWGPCGGAPLFSSSTERGNHLRTRHHKHMSNCFFLIYGETGATDDEFESILTAPGNAISVTCGGTFRIPTVIESSQGYSCTNYAAPCVFPFLYEGEYRFQCTDKDHTGRWCGTTSSYDADAAQISADHRTIHTVDIQTQIFSVQLISPTGQQWVSSGLLVANFSSLRPLSISLFLLLSIIVLAIVSCCLRAQSHAAPSILEPGRFTTKNSILKSSGIMRFDALVLATLIMLVFAPSVHAEKRQPFQPGNQIMSGTFPSQGDETQASVYAQGMLYTHTGSELHVYDIQDNRWSEISLSGPASRRGHRIQWSHVDHNVYLTGGYTQPNTDPLNPSVHKYTAPGTIKKNVIDIWQFSGATMEFKDLTEMALANAGVSSPAQVQGTENMEDNLVPHFRWQFGWAYSGVPGKMLLFGGYLQHYIYQYYCEFWHLFPAQATLINCLLLFALSSIIALGMHCRLMIALFSQCRISGNLIAMKSSGPRYISQS